MQRSRCSCVYVWMRREKGGGRSIVFVSACPYSTYLCLRICLRLSAPAVSLGATLRSTHRKFDLARSQTRTQHTTAHHSEPPIPARACRENSPGPNPPPPSPPPQPPRKENLPQNANGSPPPMPTPVSKHPQSPPQMAMASCRNQSICSPVTSTTSWSKTNSSP